MSKNEMFKISTLAILALMGLMVMLSAFTSLPATNSVSGCDPEDLDMALINKADHYIQMLEDGSDDSRKGLQFLKITHCGNTVFRKLYNNDYYRAEPDKDYHELQSATKTLSALAIGILMQKQPELFPEGVNTSVKSLLRGKAPSELVDKIPADITLKHELTMTTNRTWKDFAAGAGETDEFQLLRETDKGSLALLVSLFPGEPNYRQNEQTRRFSQPLGVHLYNTGSSHMLSVIIHYNVDPGVYGNYKRTQAFLQANLLDKLGIKDMLWETKCNIKDTRYYTCTPGTDDGINAGGWNGHMRPDDFSKIGQLILDGGKVGHEQVIHQSFIDNMTAQYNPAWSFFANMPGNSHYGYQMWIETEYGSDDLAGARGYGKQDSFVMQNEDMVVTFMADISDWRAVAKTGDTVKHVMRRYISPAHKVNDEGDCVVATLKQHVIHGRALFSPSAEGEGYAANGIRWIGSFSVADDSKEVPALLKGEQDTTLTLAEHSPGNWRQVDSCH